MLSTILPVDIAVSLKAAKLSLHYPLTWIKALNFCNSLSIPVQEVHLLRSFLKKINHVLGVLPGSSQFLSKLLQQWWLSLGCRAVLTISLFSPNFCISILLGHYVEDKLDFKQLLKILRNQVPSFVWCIFFFIHKTPSKSYFKLFATAGS